MDDTRGETGRSAARNKAVEAADAEWLFFLDADDLMHPECLEHSLHAIEGNDAVFGLITELVDGNVVTRYQVPEITSYEELIARDPFLTVKMGHFVRREVARNLPFDVTMDCGEDWDYYLRLWRRHDCIKINRPFFIKVRGSHSTGPRSATGRQWNEAVSALLERARKAVEASDAEL